MHFISETLSNILLFVALYFEVFFLITYFETRDSSSVKTTIDEEENPDKLPTVSAIVPVWNEETTILKTIFSLLKLNYPKEKLKIIIVDDGSTDKTWNVIQRFNRNKQVKLLRKENGGKHTALNYALTFVDTELVGCLDADSFVHPQALLRIARKFADKEVMAVTPSVKIFEPKGVLGLIQKAEYIFGIFLRKVFSQLNAVYITPGPFSIFRKSVFDQIGGYKHAHNTEDMEIAMRMQKNHMKIDHAVDAFIYTVAPTRFKALFKQRLRWAYGFIKNFTDYRDMFMRPSYGHLGMVVLPAAGFSFLSSIYVFFMLIYDWLNQSFVKVQEISTVGFAIPTFKFDPFYLNTDAIMFISMFAVLGTVFIIVVSRKMAQEKTRFGFDSIAFLLLYTFIAPLWMTKALYNVVLSKGNKWR